ncbi:MAG: 16S rRNA (guanine(527)-N(7))-methyltransferase RsmG [Rhizobacter sp.]|nr:16S rRNA (guanine(527)-N(7))-methyltransferase RsmG [Rhizobacter sp.]
MPLGGEKVAKFVAYLRLIERWNGTYNLTSIRDLRSMATQHIVDCLAATDLLTRRRDPQNRKRLLDVGSGAGLPGIVIAVALPDTEVVCVESVGKKAAFLRQAAATLRAENVTALHIRAEQLSGRFDVVASRAVTSLSQFVAITRHLLADNGEWMAMKGRVPTREIAALSKGDVSVDRLSVPGLGAERCVIWMRPGVSARS